jgi:hypothetical protein
MIKNQIIKYTIIIIATVIFSRNYGLAQSYTVSGYVADSITGETVIGVVVLLKGTYKGTTTDVNGFFRLSGIEKGKQTLMFSHLSYQTKELKVSVEDKDILLPETMLNEKKNTIEEVSIVGIGKKNLGDREVETSMQELSVKAITTIPTAGGDVFKAIKYLPGIEGSSPISPLVSVRGGDPGENMIMLDGMTIYNPYHVVASMGIFNTNSIKDVELLLGGYGAEYGGRNSSIINITTKEGNNKGFHGEVTPTTNYFNGYCEFPVTGNSTMTIAARGYYPIILNFLLYSSTWFYDVNLSYNLKLNERNKLTIKFFSSNDQQKLSFNSIYNYIANMFNDEELSNAFKGINISNTNRWKNNAGTVMLHSIISPRLYWETQVYGSFHASNNTSILNFDYKGNDTVQPMKFRFSSQFKSSINDICIKSSLNYKLAEWNNLKVGLEANNYNFNNQANIDLIENDDEDRKPFLLAYYGEDKIKISSLIIRPGIRFSKYSFSDIAYPEPRLNAVLNLPGDFDIRAGWGIYYQYIISMNTSEYEMSQMLDYYYPLKNVPPARSVHYIAGIGKKLSQFLSLSLDAYYKDISRTYTFDLTQSEIEAFSFSDKLQQGQGKAYGIEALLKGEYSKLSGWTSIGLSRSTRQYPQYNDGREFLSDYDRTLAFKGVCNYQVTEKLSYSASWQVLSGHPITISQTQQSYFYYDPINNNLMWSPQYVTDYKNNARLPMVIQIDVGFKKLIREGFGAKLAKLLHADESYIIGSIQNLTFFRRNIDYYFYVPPLNYYIPFGMNYFPIVNVGYVIKF